MWLNSCLLANTQVPNKSDLFWATSGIFLTKPSGSGNSARPNGDNAFPNGKNTRPPENSVCDNDIFL
jgi:hypothetical protein